MVTQNQIIAITATTAIVVAIVVGAYILSVSRDISGSGTIESNANLEIYADQNATLLLTHIDWSGNQALTPNSNATVLLFIKNTGDSVLTLNYTTFEWQPIAAQAYLYTSWNYNGTKIEPNQIITIEYTLHVSKDVYGIRDFSFNTKITGTN